MFPLHWTAEILHARVKRQTPTGIEPTVVDDDDDDDELNAHG